MLVDSYSLVFLRTIGAVLSTVGLNGDVRFPSHDENKQSNRRGTERYRRTREKYRYDQSVQPGKRLDQQRDRALAFVLTPLRKSTRFNHSEFFSVNYG